jgi:hypothetical protein
MRTEIADLIADVFDVDESARWRDWPDNFWEWVDEIDDLLPYGAHEAVGWSLNDDDEAAAVQPFLDRRNALIDDIGNAPFDRYETDPRWLKVREAGYAALAALGRSV